MAVLHIDLDDTTVNLIERVRCIHNSGVSAENHLTFSDFSDWRKNGLIIEKYLHIEGLFSSLEIKENAVDILRKLSERHTVKFLTAFPTARSAMEKVAFVEEHFPFIGLRNMTLTWDKGSVYGNLLFDDSPVFFNQYKGLKVLFDSPYNQHVSAEYRVSSWLEFYDTILEMERRGLLKEKIFV